MDEDDIRELFEETVKTRYAYFDVSGEVKEAVLDFLNGLPGEMSVAEALRVIDNE